MRRSSNVATPSTTFTFVVPDSVAPEGELPSSSFTWPPETGVPDLSVTATWTGGEMPAFASTTSGGWVLNVTNAGARLWFTAGDHTGSKSRAGLFVTRVCADPSAFIT